MLNIIEKISVAGYAFFVGCQRYVKVKQQIMDLTEHVSFKKIGSSNKSIFQTVMYEHSNFRKSKCEQSMFKRTTWYVETSVLAQPIAAYANTVIS